MNLSSKKMIVAGIHGSGKTYFVQYLARQFKAIVYSPYPEEWKNEDVIYIKTTDYINEFPVWCNKIIQLAKAKKVNLAIIDDADLIFKTHFDVCAGLRTMHISNRHLGSGLAIAYVTRRIQDIPTKIYGSVEYMALFTIDSPQVIRILNDFYDGLGDKVKLIPYGSYQFLLKEIGKEPVLMKV